MLRACDLCSVKLIDILVKPIFCNNIKIPTNIDAISPGNERCILCMSPRPDVLVCSINHDCIAPVLDNTKRARSVSTFGQRVIIFVTNRRLRRVNLRARVYDFVTADRNRERQRTARSVSIYGYERYSLHQTRLGSRRGIPTLIIVSSLIVDFHNFAISEREKERKSYDRLVASAEVLGRSRLSERRRRPFIRRV